MTIHYRSYYEDLMFNLIFLFVIEVYPVDYSGFWIITFEYISVIILNIFPILTIIIIDSMLFIFEFLTKLESHKSNFHHQTSHILKICLYSCLVYWISFSFYETTTNPLISRNPLPEQSSGFINNDISLITYQAMSIYIFQFLLSRGNIQKDMQLSNYWLFIHFFVIFHFRCFSHKIRNDLFLQKRRN